MIRLFIITLSLTFVLIHNSQAQFVNQQETPEAQTSVLFSNTAEEKETSPLFSPKFQAPRPKRPESEQIRLFGKGDVKIIAIVNGEMISSTDIEERAKLFVMNTKIPYNSETKNMIIAKVIQAAIDEKLKLQEAEKQGIEISDKEIKSSIKTFEKSNNIPQGTLRQKLAQSKIGYNVFREQIKSDLAWIHIVRRELMNFGRLTDKEVEEHINTSAKDMLTPKYMVMEIVIKEKDAQNLEMLVANLRKDPRFELYASQFSAAPSASNGGNLGWLNKNQLSEPLNSKVLSMKEGEVSDPIKVGKDFYIIKLAQKYIPQRDKPHLPNKEEMRNFMENKKMEEISAKHLHNIRQKAVIELRN